ncbi:MAG: cellulase family glycosylhydrolase [Xanthomonadales bacterium]
MNPSATRMLVAARAALVLLTGLAPAASSDTEVTHGATGVRQSAAEWWDIPYPERFDASLLVAEQPRIGVDGNRFVTPDGMTFVFRGVNIADPDKLTHQGRWDRALFEEVALWGANTVRLPVHPVAWRQRGPDWFLERIDEAVFWANALGLYLIIDWHSIGNLETAMFQHPMYQTDRVETTDFWRRIAFRYRDVPTVAVYELFNEPTDNFIGVGSGSLGSLDWASWRETLETMIDVVQVYNPAAIVLVGGMNWAYDLQPVADAPVRRENVAYAAHAYPQKASPAENTRAGWFAAWERDWGFVADRYPVIASEIGWVSEDGFNAHVPVIDNSGAYGPNLVRYMEGKGVSWTVWNFDPDWSPTMSLFSRRDAAGPCGRPARFRAAFAARRRVPVDEHRALARNVRRGPGDRAAGRDRPAVPGRFDHRDVAGRRVRGELRPVRSGQLRHRRRQDAEPSVAAA